MQDEIIKNRKKKIGIMGGTFNPIHIGHLIIAEQAWEQFELDKVLFMPASQPPHKMGEAIEEDINRVAMVRLAIHNNPHFELSLFEVNRQGVSYTAETLRQLTKQYPNTEFCFIMGGDSIVDIETWREPKTVMELGHLLACTRNDVDDTRLTKEIKYLKDKYHEEIRKLMIPQIDISSTMIRERIQNDLSIKYMVPDSVLSYIKEHGLYQNII